MKGTQKPKKSQKKVAQKTLKGTARREARSSSRPGTRRSYEAVMRLALVCGRLAADERG